MRIGWAAMDNLRFTWAETYTVDIFVAGVLADAKRICQAHCLDVGLCVTISPTDFIYTGGSERGVRIGLVNYPRFPKPQDEVWGQAELLACKLIEGLYQHSALLVASDHTLWITRRAE